MKTWQPPRGIRWQKQGEALVIVSEGPAGRGRKGSEQLAQRLLSLGGSEVWISEEFASRGPVQMLLREGVSLPGNKATLHCGFMNRCHDNVLALCAQDPARQWMAGFALGSDGCWREHSWCVDSKGALLETTYKPRMYFGFVMPEDIKKQAARVAMSEDPAFQGLYQSRRRRTKPILHPDVGKAILQAL